MTFGEELARIRKQRNLDQVMLSISAGYSNALVNQIEGGRTLPTAETARDILRRLNVSQSEMDRLIALLEQERRGRKATAKKKGKTPDFAFGAPLKKLLARLEVKSADFADKTEQKLVTVQLWLSGKRIPTDKTFKDTISPVLKNLGASEADIDLLRFTHLADMLTRAMDVVYLSPDEHAKISECMADCLTGILKSKE